MIQIRQYIVFLILNFPFHCFTNPLKFPLPTQSIDNSGHTTNAKLSGNARSFKLIYRHPPRLLLNQVRSHNKLIPTFRSSRVIQEVSTAAVASRGLRPWAASGHVRVLSEEGRRRRGGGGGGRVGGGVASPSGQWGPLGAPGD